MGSKRAGMSWPHAVGLLTAHGPRGFWALALWRLNRLHYSKDIGIPTLPATTVNRSPAPRSRPASNRIWVRADGDGATELSSM